MKLASRSAFDSASGSRLLPMGFSRIHWDEFQILATSLAGDWLFMQRCDLDRVVAGELPQDEALFASMDARHLVLTDPARLTLAPLPAQCRTRDYTSLKINDHALPSADVLTLDCSTIQDAYPAPAKSQRDVPQNNWLSWLDHDAAASKDSTGTFTKTNANQPRVIIMRAQAALHARGHEPCGINGLLNRRTLQAIRQLQEAFLIGFCWANDYGNA